MLKATIFSGAGGQGVLMMGYVFGIATMRDGKHITYLPAYGAEVRGGTANCTVIISDKEIASPVTASPDFAIVMNKPSMNKYQGMIKKGGLMVINSSLVDSDPDREDIDIIKIPANDIATELGSIKTVNMIMLGVFAAKTGITSIESIMNSLTEILKGKRADLMKLNRKGLDRGAQYATSYKGI